MDGKDNFDLCPCCFERKVTKFFIINIVNKKLLIDNS